MAVVGAAFISAITVPALAWLYPQETMGRLAMFLVIANLSVQILPLGLDQAFVREYYASSNKALLLRNSLITPVLMTLVIFVVILMTDLSAGISKLAFGESQFSTSILLMAACFFALVVRYIDIILRVQDRAWFYAAFQIGWKLLFLLLAIVAIFLGAQKIHTTLFASHVAASAIICGYGIRCIFRSRDFAGYRTAMLVPPYYDHRLFSYGLPLCASAIAISGVKYSGHIALRESWPFEELAIYGVAVSIGSGAALVASIFNAIWPPLLYRLEADGKAADAMALGSGLVVAVTTLITTTLGAFGWLIQYVLPASYNEVCQLLACIVLAPLYYTLSEAAGSGLNIARRTDLSLYSALVGSMVTIVVALTFVPPYGSRGAALATAVGYFVFFVCRTELSRRVYKPVVSRFIYLVSGVNLAAASVSLWDENHASGVNTALWILMAMLGALQAVRSITTAKKMADKGLDSGALE